MPSKKSETNINDIPFSEFNRALFGTSFAMLKIVEIKLF
jgi:hypothetical protein